MVIFHGYIEGSFQILLKYTKHTHSMVPNTCEPPTKLCSNSKGMGTSIASQLFWMHHFFVRKCSKEIPITFMSFAAKNSPDSIPVVNSPVLRVNPWFFAGSWIATMQSPVPTSQDVDRCEGRARPFFERSQTFFSWAPWNSPGCSMVYLHYIISEYPSDSDHFGGSPLWDTSKLSKLW